MTEPIHMLRAWLPFRLRVWLRDRRPGQGLPIIMRVRVIICVGIIICVSACGATPRETPPSYGDWRSALGESVDRVRFSHLIDWQPLDREWVMLEFSDRRLFVLELRDPCITDAREARSLRLDTAMKNTLHRSDRVRVDEYDCLIETIRPLTSRAERNRYRGSASASRDG